MEHHPDQPEKLFSQPSALLDEQQEARFASWIESQLDLLERQFEHLATPFAGRMPRALLKRMGRSAGGAAPDSK